MFTTLKETSFYLNKSQLIRQSTFSRAQIYRWSNGITERKQKERKRIPEPVAESAVEMIKEYPHFSGEKGQAYMLYHELGYIPQQVYKNLKQTVKHVIFGRSQIVSFCLRRHLMSMNGHRGLVRYGLRILLVSW